MECTSGHVVHLRITLHVIIWGGDCIPGYAGCIPRSKCLLLFLRKKIMEFQRCPQNRQKNNSVAFFHVSGFSFRRCVKRKKQTDQGTRVHSTAKFGSCSWQSRSPWKATHGLTNGDIGRSLKKMVSSVGFSHFLGLVALVTWVFL